MAEGKRDQYAAAGVDYEILDRGKLSAQGLSRHTIELFRGDGANVVEASIGESALVIDVGGSYIATLSEGLGTRNIVADAMRAITGRTYYDSMAWSTVATIANDLATSGARPLSINAFWAAGESEWFDDSERVADLNTGWANACIEIGARWGGGETQAIKGLVQPGRIVLGGSAIGVIDPKERLLSGDRLQEGDAILIAPSSGIHDNGLTLARRLADSLPNGYRSKMSDGNMYGQALLEPSCQYSPVVQSVFASGADLHYAANVTGHGWRKIMRGDRDDLRYRIDRIPEAQPIFGFLQNELQMGDEEAYGTFNMGAGYALFVAGKDVARAKSRVLRDTGISLLHAGVVEKGPKEVIIRPKGITYSASSLAVR